MIKKVTIVLFLALCYSLLFFLLAEGTLRIFSEVTKVYYPANRSLPALFKESAEGYGLLPSEEIRHYSLYKDYIATYGTNTSGLRSSEEYKKPKPRDVKRVFMLGDSLVFGIGVNNDQTVSYRLQSLLNAHGEITNYEVLNLGVQGYSCDNSYVRLKRFINLEPDILIFVIAGMNDFLDILNHTWVIDEKNDLQAIEEKARHINDYHRFVNGPKHLYNRKPYIIEQVLNFLRNRSVFYAFLGTLRHRNRYRFDEEGMKKETVEREIRGVAKSIDVLDRFFKYTGEKGLKTVFVLELFREDIVKSSFLKYLSEKTPYIIDLDQLDKNNDFYLPRDGHWSVNGSRQIASLIYNYLIKEGLVK